MSRKYRKSPLLLLLSDFSGCCRAPADEVSSAWADATARFEAVGETVASCLGACEPGEVAGVVALAGGVGGRASSA